MEIIKGVLAGILVAAIVFGAIAWTVTADDGPGLNTVESRFLLVWLPMLAGIPSGFFVAVHYIDRGHAKEQYRKIIATSEQYTLGPQPRDRSGKGSGESGQKCSGSAVAPYGGKAVMNSPTAEAIATAKKTLASSTPWWREPGKTMVAAYDEAIAVMRDLLSLGVEMDDDRLDCLVVQIDRDDIERAKAVIAKAKET